MTQQVGSTCANRLYRPRPSRDFLDINVRCHVVEHAIPHFALSISMLLKLGFAISLLVAQQRFLQSKGLVLLTLTSLLGTVIVTLLLGIVPGVLVSITDAIGAIVVGALGIIWGLFLLIGAIVSLIKSSHLDHIFKS